MPLFTRLLGVGVMLVGLVIAIYVSVWILLFFFALSIAAVVWSHLRDFLVAKGIVTPAANASDASPVDSRTGPVLDGEFKRIEEDKR